MQHTPCRRGSNPYVSDFGMESKSIEVKKKDPAQDIPGPSDGTAALYAQSLEKIQALEARIRTLEQQVSGLERRNEKLTALIRKSDRLLMQNHQILMDSLGEE